MRFFSGNPLSDRDADAVLAGRAPADGEDGLQELAAFFRDARIVLAEPPARAVADAHLAAIAEAARTSGPPVAEPSKRTLRDRRVRPARLAAASAGFAILAGFGGAAYAGVLPDPVQGKVAHIANNIGISLPGNANDVHQGDVGNQDQSQQGNTNQGETNQAGTQQGDTNQPDSQQGDTNRGDTANQDQGAQTNTDDGAQGNADHVQSTKDAGNKDEGPQGNTDGGAPGTTQRSTDSGPQGKTDGAAQPDQSGGDSSGGQDSSGDGGG
jgi:hypothetical protein